MKNPSHSHLEVEKVSIQPGEERTGDQTLALPSEAVKPSPLVKEHAGLVVIQGLEIARHNPDIPEYKTGVMRM